jgi:hypothetical protein
MPGSYDLDWKSAVAIGIVAGRFPTMMNVRPTARAAAERDAAHGWAAAGDRFVNRVRATVGKRRTFRSSQLELEIAQFLD